MLPILASRIPSFSISRPRPLAWGVVAALVVVALAAACGDSTDPVLDNEEGAAEIGPAGGTVTAAGGLVTLVFPAGAVTSNITVTVTAASSPPAATGLVPGASFTFGPSGTTFAQPVTMQIGYAAASIPGGVQESNLRLQKVVGGAWQEIAGSSVDVGNDRVSGSVTSFSTFGVVAAPPAVSFITVTGADTLWSAGDTVRLAAEAFERDGTSIPGQTFTWESSDTTVVSVDATGLATATGPNGSVTITATTDTVDGIALVGVMTGAGGGAVIDAGGQVTLVFPPSAVTQPFFVTVTPDPSPPADTGYVANTAFDFGPPGAFSQPVSMTIGYDPADVPAGVMESDLRLWNAVGSNWFAVAGSTVDPATNMVTGSVTSFSTYGVLPAAGPPPTLSGEWNGTVDNSGGVTFIVDLVDPDDGTLNASVPLFFGAFSQSIYAIGQKSGDNVVLEFRDQPTGGNLFWTYTAVVASDGLTMDGTITGPGNGNFPALSANTMHLIKQ